ncbi:MAG: 16S rRNA (cytidine(1402)-2'-O)-methyltransferase [Deltaproteobacteria bacterium]|nr:16S rRNA (cytidine(1402)-2'-O)-methyltransferase [Deltaproteobacteria bacterium]
MSGTLYIIATPIGNLEDITLRALRVLKEVDLIAAEDTRHTKKLLTHFDIHTPLTSFFQGNERAKAGDIVRQLLAGKNIALVSDAGTPCISDPGYPLLIAAIEAGITVVPIPGPSALTAAISAAGLPTDRFTFVGFLPDKPGKRKKVLEELRTRPETLVFYVSPWKVEKTLADCLAILGNRKAVLCREVSKIHEEFVRENLQTLRDHLVKKPLKGEVVLLVEGAKRELSETDMIKSDPEFMREIQSGMKRLRQKTKRYSFRKVFDEPLK